MECSDLVLILLDLIKICKKITRHYFRLRDFNFKYLSAIYESPEGLFEIRDSIHIFNNNFEYKAHQEKQ